MPKKIPHFSSWPVIKEEFTGQWKAYGEQHLSGVQPLMEITRTQNINGEMHVVTALEWGRPIRFHGAESDRAMFLQNHFLLDTLWRVQKEANLKLPAPECRPAVNLFEETDRQKP